MGASLILFFIIFHPFFSPGKVANYSSLERKTNRLVIHKNVNTALVPLATSVCVVWDHSGLSVQLWTCDKCSHCFQMSNTDILSQICSIHLHTQTHSCSHIYMRAYTYINVHTPTKVLAHMLTRTHHSGPVMCHGDRGQILCDVCGGYIAWEKDQRSYQGCERANNNSLKCNSSERTLTLTGGKLGPSEWLHRSESPLWAQRWAGALILS